MHRKQNTCPHVSFTGSVHDWRHTGQSGMLSCFLSSFSPVSAVKKQDIKLAFRILRTIYHLVSIYVQKKDLWHLIRSFGTKKLVLDYSTLLVLKTFLLFGHRCFRGNKGCRFRAFSFRIMSKTSRLVDIT